MAKETVQLDIHEHDEQEGVIFLGTVIVPKNKLKKAKEVVIYLWSDFQEGQPDADSDYIDFLIESEPKLFLGHGECNEQVIVGN